MKKKLISTLLCFTMTAALLAGCGGKDGDNAGASDASADSQQETEQAPAQEDGGETEDVDAADLEPVTLHFILFGDKKSAVDEVWAAIADYTSLSQVTIINRNCL